MTDVLDSSALLALLLDEPGADHVRDILRSSVMSAVNYSEVIARLQDLGHSDSQIALVMSPLPLSVAPYSKTQAETAGKLRRATKTYGLSLGDRFCLALALELSAVAVTADQAWAALDVGVDVRLIR